MLKTVTEGWIEFNWENTTIYKSDESWEKGNPYVEDTIKVLDILDQFANKKVRITVEEIDK